MGATTFRLARTAAAALVVALVVTLLSASSANADASGLISYLNAAGMTPGTWSLFSAPAGGVDQPGTVTMVNRVTGEQFAITSYGNGKYAPIGTGTVAPRIAATSDVLADSVGAGASSAQAANVALAESGQLAATGTLTAVGSKFVAGAGAVGVSIMGLQMGLQTGSMIDSKACSLGVSQLCMPKNAGYASNSDLSANPNGWAPPWVAGSPSGGAAPTTDPGLIETGYPVVTNEAALAFGRSYGAGTFDANAVAAALSVQEHFSGTSTDGRGKLDGLAANFTVWCKQTSGSITAVGSASKPTGGYFANALPFDRTASVTAGAQPCTSGTFDHLSAQLQVGGNVVTSQWYPTGNANRPTYDPNPDRQWRTTATCSGGTTPSALSVVFKETDANPPVFPNAPACPAGTILQGWKVEELGGPATRTVGNYIVPTSIQNLSGSTNSAAPGSTCMAGGCYLDLYKINPDGTRTECYGTSGACTGWFADANKASDYECTYGKPGTHNVVALSQCNVLSPTFDPAQLAKGNTVGDPRDGSVPDAPDQPVTQPVGTPGGDSQGCYPHGWAAFNPVEWVLQPVECAWRWAMYPSDGVMTQWKTYIAAISAKPPVSLFINGIAFVSAVYTSWSTSGSSCTPPFCSDVPDEYGIISAAVGIADGNSSYRIVYVMMETGIWLTALFVIYRMLNRTFGGKE